MDAVVSAAIAAFQNPEEHAAVVEDLLRTIARSSTRGRRSRPLSTPCQRRCPRLPEPHFHRPPDSNSVTRPQELALDPTKPRLPALGSSKSGSHPTLVPTAVLSW